MYLSELEMRENIKYYTKIGLWLFWLLYFAITCGEIFRQEASPWVWEQYVRRVEMHGTIDGILTVVSYLVFYSSGYIIPYYIGKFIIIVKYEHKRSNGIYSGKFKSSLCIISIGCLILLIATLRPMIYTINYIFSSSILFFSVCASFIIIIIGIKAIVTDIYAYKSLQPENEQ
jgi:hypothetical protein